MVAVRKSRSWAELRALLIEKSIPWQEIHKPAILPGLTDHRIRDRIHTETKVPGRQVSGKAQPSRTNSQGEDQGEKKRSFFRSKYIERKLESRLY